jgi:hypothetical protein
VGRLLVPRNRLAKRVPPFARTDRHDRRLADAEDNNVDHFHEHFHPVNVALGHVDVVDLDHLVTNRQAQHLCRGIELNSRHEDTVGALKPIALPQVDSGRLPFSLFEIHPLVSEPIRVNFFRHAADLMCRGCGQGPNGPANV